MQINGADPLSHCPPLCDFKMLKYGKICRGVSSLFLSKEEGLFTQRIKFHKK